MRLVDQFERGLDAPICLTWELTYACNLACAHCLSSSGRRDPRELSTVEAKAVVDELERMQVFYVNIGGGEPTVRPDFWELVDYATAHRVGVKFSTNGVRITPEVAARLAGSDYVDVQISLDGATAEVNDAVRGTGSYATALRAMENLHAAGMRGFKISVVCTRHNVDQLDAFAMLADRFGAQLRLTRLRPSGRGADVWDQLHLLPGQQRQLYDWLVEHGDGVLTGDSFFHLAAYGSALPGLNLCGAGRVVCLIDPVGDVYACPFAIHENFLAGNVRSPGGFAGVWRTSQLFRSLRRIRRLPRRMHGREVLHRAAAGRPGPGVRGGARHHRSVHCGPARRAAADRRPLARRRRPGWPCPRHHRTPAAAARLRREPAGRDRRRRMTTAAA
jgi:mycofactocin radical SAM maturase